MTSSSSSLVLILMYFFSLCISLKLTCDIGQQDGEENHRSKKGGDHDVQRIPAARGHLEVEEENLGVVEGPRQMST